MSDFGKHDKSEEILKQTNISNQKQINKKANLNFNSSNTFNITNKPNTLTQPQKFPLKTILYTITTIILILATLGGCLFGILSNKKINAIPYANITEANQIGGGANLFDSTTTVNPTVFNDLLAKTSVGKSNQLGWGSDEYCTAPRPDGGMNYVININDFWWQVVYRSGDYLTLWLADRYGTGTYYYRSSSSGYTTNYATLESTKSVRTYLNGDIYNGLFGSYTTLANQIIATPNDLYRAGITWQSGQGTDGTSTNETAWWSSSYYTKYSGLGSSTDTSTAAYDKLWLPSGPELFSGVSGSSGGYLNPGIWGLTQTELMFDTTTSTSPCWLRSGLSYHLNHACLLNSGGTQNYNYVGNTHGVRPALHMALPKLQEALTKTINITNASPTNITNISYTRETTSTPTGSVTATYGNNTKPRLQTSAGTVDLTDTAGTGKLGAVNFTYTITNNILTINFSNIPNELYALTLDIIPNLDYRINITAPNAGVVDTYENGNAVVIIQPTTGFWVNSFVIDGTTYQTEYQEYTISDSPNAFKVIYYASERTNRFELYFRHITNNINLTLNCSTTSLTNLKESGGAQIVGVAVNTTAGGDAKIVANTLNEQDSTQDTVTLAAWVNAGYTFAGWSTDGGVTYLTDSEGVQYGVSATIPADQVRGKVVTACFTQNINTDINTDTSTMDGYL